MSNPVYFHCPVCNGIRHKKNGIPKKRILKCLKCGTRYTYTHGFKEKVLIKGDENG